MNNDILNIFWTNVDWHRQNKKMNWIEIVGGNSSTAIHKTSNLTLKRIQAIAEILDIDDYAILFESLED